MEPVKIKVVVNGIDYTVIVTHIGEVDEHPDGGGDLSIEYHTMPECPKEDEEELFKEINKVFHKAIRAAIEEAKQKEKDKEQ